MMKGAVSAKTILLLVSALLVLACAVSVYATASSGYVFSKKIDSGTGGISLANHDYFGRSVAVDGDTIIVGASHDDTGATDIGAVYLLNDRNKDGDYADNGENIKLSDDTEGISLAYNDSFGASVAVSDDTIIVGAPGDDAGGWNRGAVYLLNDKNGDGDYADNGENIKLSDDTEGISLSDRDEFGSAVASDGDTIIVGAARDDTGGRDRGAVYVLNDKNKDGDYADTGENVKLSDATEGITLANRGYFGFSVAISGDTIIVGAAGDGTDGWFRGAVYLLNDKNDDGDYSDVGENVKLSRDTNGISLSYHDHHLFGTSVAVFGDTIIVGAKEDHAGTTFGGGAVYLLNDKNNDGDYADDGENVRISDDTDGMSLTRGDFFGSAVAADGDTLVVGTEGDDTGGMHRGAVYVFKKQAAPTPCPFSGMADWENNGNTCSAQLPSGKTAGYVADLVDSDGDYRGTASFVCSANGEWVLETADPPHSCEPVTVPPTVTATHYHNSANETVTSVTRGDDIITSIVFSEALSETAGTDSTARPQIFGQVGSDGTPEQFDIITSGSIGRGECKGNSDRTGYACVFGTAGTTGLYRAYVGAYADTSGLAGVPQTYETNSNGVSVAAPKGKGKLRWDSGDDAFTGTKTPTRSVPLPDTLDDTPALSLLDTPFGTVLRTNVAGSLLTVNGRFVMNHGNTQQLYYSDTLPIGIKDGTLVSGGHPQWSGNTARQQWDGQHAVPANRYYWIASSMHITYSSGSFTRVQYIHAPETPTNTDYSSGQVSFTGTKSGTQALTLPAAVAETAGLELITAPFGGTLLKTLSPGDSFSLAGLFRMNHGNTQQVYYADTLPTSVTDGTLLSGGAPQWLWNPVMHNRNTSSQQWTPQTSVPANRYYWIRSSMDITYGTGSWIGVEYRY